MSEFSGIRKYIRLDSVGMPDANTLLFRFTSTVPFFKKTEFFVRYSEPIMNFDESTAGIIFSAVMAPVAQASGAELSIPRLDKDFAHSLEKVSAFWNKSYGWEPLKLSAERIQSDRKTTGCGMLFSGGIDSMGTYIENRDKHPRLFTVLGADIPHSETAYIERLKNDFYDAFSKQENAPLTYAETDIRAVLDETALSKRFKVGWYGEISSGLFMTTLFAPIAGLKDLLTSSCSLEHPHGGCGGDSELLDNIAFAGTRLRVTQSEIPRTQKIKRFLAPNPQIHRFIRVCWKQFEKLNCSRCSKCLRTICELLVNNIDPNDVNFEMTDRTLMVLRARMTKSFYHFFYSSTELGFFRQIQDAVHLDEIKDIHRSRDFFKWYKDFSEIHRVRPSWYRRGCYLMESLRMKLAPERNR